MREARTIPAGHKPTALQQEIIDKLDYDNIEWTMVDTAGGCNVLYVVDDHTGLREVVVTNCEDDGFPIFVVDASCGGDECAMFSTDEEVWGEVLLCSQIADDFLNVARFFTQEDSDPYEHYLANGMHVLALFP